MNDKIGIPLNCVFYLLLACISYLLPNFFTFFTRKERESHNISPLALSNELDPSANWIY